MTIVILSPCPLGTETANFHGVDENPLDLLDELAAVVEDPHDKGFENFKDRDSDHRQDPEADNAVHSAPTVDYLGGVPPDALKEASDVKEAETQKDINTALSKAMKTSNTATIVLGYIEITKDLMKNKDTHN